MFSVQRDRKLQQVWMIELDFQSFRTIFNYSFKLPADRCYQISPKYGLYLMWHLWNVFIYISES